MRYLSVAICAITPFSALSLPTSSDTDSSLAQQDAYSANGARSLLQDTNSDNALAPRGAAAAVAVWTASLESVGSIFVAGCTSPITLAGGVSCGAALFIDAGILVIGGLLGIAAAFTPFPKRDGGMPAASEMEIFYPEKRDLSSNDQHYAEYNGTEALHVARSADHDLYYTNQKRDDDGGVIHQYSAQPRKRMADLNIAQLGYKEEKRENVVVNGYFTTPNPTLIKNNKDDIQKSVKDALRSDTFYDKDKQLKQGAWCFDVVKGGQAPAAPGVLTIGKETSYDLQNPTLKFDKCREKRA